jgi:hypothetical protein
MIGRISDGDQRVQDATGRGASHRVVGKEQDLPDAVFVDFDGRRPAAKNKTARSGQCGEELPS